jgi:hypothetical protein
MKPNSSEPEPEKHTGDRLLASATWLDCAEWGVDHRSDGLSFIGIPDRIPREYNTPVIKLVWLGPLPKLQADWLLDAIKRKQSNI